MADKQPRALIPFPSGGLANIGSGPKSILSGMVSDALALARAREQSLAAARFRIGDYEFRDLDYRQILILAKALELEPEVFINLLKSGLKVGLTQNLEIFHIVKIQSLNSHPNRWASQLLPHVIG